MVMSAGAPASDLNEVTSAKPAADRTPLSQGAAPRRFGMRSRIVLGYLMLALSALTPGLLLWQMPAVETHIPGVDAWLRTIRRGLVDIHFGGGVRFWLGVVGGLMMALLLLYPVRKALAKRRWLGNIGAWFHLHIVLGIAGPVLVLYHCNFRHGAPDANVALWTMLSVAASGIVGQFIYASVSADFYANKQKARQQLDAINAALALLDAMPTARQKLSVDLETFDADLLTPRRGIAASLKARLRMERRRRDLSRSVSRHIEQCALLLRLDDVGQTRVRRSVAGAFGNYMRLARHTSSRSVREQIWARWRLFHMPAFLIMVVAMALHVAAVWDWTAVFARLAPATDLASPSTRLTIVPPPIVVEVAPRPTQLPAPAWGERRVRTVPLDTDATAPQAPVLLSKPTPALRPHGAAIAPQTPS